VRTNCTAIPNPAVYGPETACTVTENPFLNEALFACAYISQMINETRREDRGPMGVVFHSGMAAEDQVRYPSKPRCLCLGNALRTFISEWMIMSYFSTKSH